MVGAGMIPIPPPDYGAVEKHVWNLSQALERIGHDVHVVNTVFGPASHQEYQFALWARRKVNALRADVVHLHTPGVASVFATLGPRRFVFTTHSRHWSTREGLGENVGFFLEKRACKRALETIAVSKMVAASLAELEVRATVIPNGVDVERYVPDRSARKGNRIVGLGEIAEHKRWHVAAAAIKGLPATLTLVGPVRDPRYASECEAAAPGQVTIAGPVDEADLVKTLAEADALAHPSVSESFGMAVVEGMACGLPIVASDVVGPLVAPNENGFVVPVSMKEAERVAAFRKAFEMLLADGHLRRLMGERSRERAVAEYAWDVVAKRVAEVYERARSAP